MKRLAFVGLSLVLLSLTACLAEDKKAEDKAPADKNPVVVIDTSAGAIKVELDAAKAPISVKNFLQYVDDKF